MRLAMTIHQSQRDADGLLRAKCTTGRSAQLSAIVGVNRTRQEIFERPERRKPGERGRFGIEADLFGNEIPLPDAHLGGSGEEFDGLTAGLEARIEDGRNGQNR
jgi:hypothetical protein